jgi:hypothetical protein
MERIAIHRNINLMRSDPTCYRWTYKALKSSRSLGLKIGDMPREDTTYFESVESVCMLGALDRVERTNTREIAAFLTGIECAPIQGTLRRLTMSPLGEKRQGLGEKAFVYSDTRQLVDFARISGICIDATGCYAIS